MAWVYTQKTTLNIISLFWLKTTDLMSSSCNMRHFFYSWRYYEKLCWQSLSKCYNRCTISNNRSRHPEVFLGKGVLKICSKFTGEHPCRSAIWIKLQSNFIEITLRHGCSAVNLLHIFRTPFLGTALGGSFWNNQLIHWHLLELETPDINKLLFPLSKIIIFSKYEFLTTFITHMNT